jgi:polar amino acid transport system substrate-binding protein
MTATFPASTGSGPDPRVADLVRSGTIRVATLPPQYTRDAITGALRGWSIDLAGALGERLGTNAVPVECPGPDEVIARLVDGSADAGFLPKSPAWADAVDFSAPFMLIEFTFLVPAGSPIGAVADADRPGVRIATVRGHASTLALLPQLRCATVLAADTLDGAFALLRDGHADAFASTRPQVIAYCGRLPGARAIEDSFGAHGMTVAVAKGRAGRLAWINEFVQEATTSGLAWRAIERAGWRGVRPPG